MRRIKRAQGLLAADEGLSDEAIAATAIGTSTVYRTKRRVVEQDLDMVSEEPRPGTPRKLWGNEEALLMAPTHASPPRGAQTGCCSRWRTRRWSS